jgi:CDP-paratose 2-epimerase
VEEKIQLSIIEAFNLIESISGKKMKFTYLDQNREGDHICYISDLSKIQSHYPEWKLTRGLDTIFKEIHDAWLERSFA